MDGKKLVNPLLDYFMEQELGPYNKESLLKLYNECLPKIDNFEGKVIIYSTGGDIDSNYVMGLDPYTSDCGLNKICKN